MVTRFDVLPFLTRIDMLEPDSGVGRTCSRIYASSLLTNTWASTVSVMSPARSLCDWIEPQMRTEGSIFPGTMVTCEIAPASGLTFRRSLVCASDGRTSKGKAKASKAAPKATPSSFYAGMNANFDDKFGEIHWPNVRNTAMYRARRYLTLHCPADLSLQNPICRKKSFATPHVRLDEM
eukprot:541710-Hanusia_phi.AAC.4